MPDLQQDTFPETRAGGFSRRDGTVEFYARVNALVDASSVVVDFGAGRGRFLEDPVSYRRGLQHLRGRVNRVIGLDVDPAVMSNDAVDEAHVIEVGVPLPLADASVDVVVSDFTFEHVEDPEWAAAELSRVLRPGGWICARTPNRWGLIALPARAVPNRWHDHVLARVQPAKQTRDTFPTFYRINTTAALARYFPTDRFQHCSYTYDSEPAYVGRSRSAWYTFLALGRLTPRSARSMLLVFVCKHDDGRSESVPGADSSHSGEEPSAGGLVTSSRRHPR